MFTLTRSIEPVCKMAEERTRARWESKTPKKKQEEGRGIKANAVAKEAEEQEVSQKPTRNRGTWTVCGRQVQSHRCLRKAELFLNTAAD